MNELIQQARELCDKASTEKANGNAVDSASLSWAITQNIVPRLCDALEAAEKELIDFHHTQQVADGKTAENARLRRINEQLTARAEQAEAENRWIPVGERLPDKIGRYLTTHVSTTYKGNKPQKKVSELDWVGDECGWLINGLHQVTHWRPLPEPPEGE